ncbi:hypothetical protein [uncultured Methanoregula sp.]|uniref:hypothetical protein n=1 Tax=uncultured Methanoregula sp. TaxID=1005933 RepID=UPI002AAC0D7C|nr:hypothetical protein [uncultured Methanoregula sp.]
MTAFLRMQNLEQQAGKMLRSRGYTPVIVSHFVRSSRYIAFNLTARRTQNDGSGETVMVKLKISLCRIESHDDATVFCQDEIAIVKRFFDRVPPDGELLRFEVWLAIPLAGFQQFEITRDGIREIPVSEEPGHRKERAA